MSPTLGVALAVLAGAANAVASVLQRKAARDEPDTRAFTIRMLWDLAHRPVWAGGIAAILVGFLLQVVALANASLAVVQPVLVMELPFTLVLGSYLLGGRMRSREWTAVLAMSAGLALLLATLAPSGGHPTVVPLGVWLTGVGTTLALVVTLTAVGQWLARPVSTAALLGIATGSCFGLIAVLIKAVTTAFAHAGVVGVFGTWQLYLILVLGPSSFFLLQNCLQAGRLVASQPALTLTNPLVATLWGVLLLGEQTRTGWWLAGAAMGGVLIVAGTVALARSPLLSHQPSEPARSGTAAG